MSRVLYPVRLRFGARLDERYARYDGVVVELTRPPVITGVENLTEIDYVPRMMAMVRSGCNQMSDMTMEQQHEALSLLQSMAAAARSVL